MGLLKPKGNFVTVKSFIKDLESVPEEVQIQSNLSDGHFTPDSLADYLKLRGGVYAYCLSRVKTIRDRSSKDYFERRFVDITFEGSPEAQEDLISLQYDVPRREK